MKEILWRWVPPFEYLEKEFTPNKAAAIKDFIDTKAYKAITINGRFNFVATYDYIVYLEMLVDKLQRALEEKTLKEENTVQNKGNDKTTEKGEWVELHICEHDQNGQYAKLDYAVICVKAGETQIRDDGVYAILAVWEEQNLVLNWYRNKVYSGKSVLKAYNSIIINKPQYRIYEISWLTETRLGGKDGKEVEMIDEFVETVDGQPVRDILCPFCQAEPNMKTQKGCKRDSTTSKK